MKRLLGAGLTMAIGNVVFSASIFAIGLAPQLWLAALGFFLSSVGVILWNVLVMSLRQSIIPGRLLGRVHGTWRTLLWGAMPIGSVLGGLLGRVDLSLPFLVGGGVATVAWLGVLPVRDAAARSRGRRQRRPAARRDRIRTGRRGTGRGRAPGPLVEE